MVEMNRRKIEQMKRANEKELGIIKGLLDLYPIDVIREAAEKKRELRTAEDNYFGSCSVCGEYDECLNIKRDHHFVCHQHKKRWHIGSNLFSAWKDETEEIWQKNYEKIKDYDEITGEEWFEGWLRNSFYPRNQRVNTEPLPF